MTRADLVPFPAAERTHAVSTSQKRTKESCRQRARCPTPQAAESEREEAEPAGVSQRSSSTRRRGNTNPIHKRTTAFGPAARTSSEKQGSRIHVPQDTLTLHLHKPAEATAAHAEWKEPLRCFF